MTILTNRDLIRAAVTAGRLRGVKRDWGVRVSAEPAELAAYFEANGTAPFKMDSPQTFRRLRIK